MLWETYVNSLEGKAYDQLFETMTGVLAKKAQEQRDKELRLMRKRRQNKALASARKNFSVLHGGGRRKSKSSRRKSNRKKSRKSLKSRKTKRRRR